MHKIRVFSILYHKVNFLCLFYRVPQKELDVATHQKNMKLVRFFITNHILIFFKVQIQIFIIFVKLPFKILITYILCFGIIFITAMNF